jgi:type I restriction-modification system DNA methylase subunit
VSYQAIIKRYLKNLQIVYNDSLTGNQHTAELSFRPPLDKLIREFAEELNGNTDIVVIFEPRNQAQVGHPDWRIHDRITLGVYGYIEAKPFTTNSFNFTQHEEQFNRYLSLGHKLIITDGIEFIYTFDDGVKPQIISLIDKALMNRSDWSTITINPQFEVMIRRFFAKPTPQYCDEGKLIELIALRTRNLSNEILHFSTIPLEEAMDDIERNAISLLIELRDLVYNHNDQNMRSDNVFADFAAQVIMFTLLYAHRVECTEEDSPTEKEHKIKEYISRDIVDEQSLRPFLTIIQYINNHGNNCSFFLTWTDECIRFLSFVHMTEKQRQRPDYHKLFELFLSKFDPRSRFDYGAYYTPSELADCIVRLVDIIARNNFNGASIYDDSNTLIDPCCGTGSFLERIQLNDTQCGSFTLCGIEILPAPYMLASYRMAILSQELENKRSKNELLLANELSDYIFGEEYANTGTVEGYELSRARKLSSRPITLVIGNPPSSDSAKTNTGTELSKILSLMDDFRPPVENRHSRQNTQKQINNPHLQFLRWGCEMLERSSTHSVLAYIVPASFLEAESYKYARKYIIEHFSSAWIVSVDADARAGVRSDSLFKTQQGRVILIATRRFGEDSTMKEYKYFDISRFAKSEKANWLEQSAETSLQSFLCYSIDTSNYALHPSLPFNEELYSSYWPVSGDAGENTVFKNHCSGVKLAPSCLFTHLKTPMLKRRSKEIMQRGMQASNEWLGMQDKPPKEVEVCSFADALNELGSIQTVDATLDNNILNYAFRPFLPMQAFLWQDLLQKFSQIGGGGTRRRPEICKAYEDEKTIGFALSHSPKDQKDSLKPFVSFCWYLPDNDLCRRGNSFIYLNQYPAGRNNDTLINNVNSQLCKKLSVLLGINEIILSTEIVFYIFAILCSQVYLDEFEGALFTVNRSDMRPRIPFINNADKFKQLAELGRKIANLEKRDYIPCNIAGYDYNEIKLMIPPNFKLLWTKSIQPFDEDNETITLSDGKTDVKIHCPLDIQRLNIGGYEVIKNAWMKFNSYDFTHCIFTADDINGFLNLANKLLEYTKFVGDVDIIMHDIIAGRYPLILPNCSDELRLF